MYKNLYSQLKRSYLGGAPEVKIPPYAVGDVFVHVQNNTVTQYMKVLAVMKEYTVVAGGKYITVFAPADVDDATRATMISTLPECSGGGCQVKDAGKTTHVLTARSKTNQDGSLINIVYGINPENQVGWSEYTGQASQAQKATSTTFINMTAQTHKPQIRDAMRHYKIAL